MDGGGLRLAGEVAIGLVSDEDKADGLMGVGAPLGGTGEEGSVLLQPLNISLGRVAFDFEDIDLL